MKRDTWLYHDVRNKLRWKHMFRACEHLSGYEHLTEVVCENFTYFVHKRRWDAYQQEEV
jgi:hypothetical protein